jgi:hypothetical protein
MLDRTHVFGVEAGADMDFTVCHSELVNPVNAVTFAESLPEENKIAGLSFVQGLMGGRGTSRHTSVLFDTPEKKAATSIMFNTPDKIDSKSFLGTLMSRPSGNIPGSDLITPGDKLKTDSTTCLQYAIGNTMLKTTGIVFDTPDKIEGKSFLKTLFGGQSDNKEEAVSGKQKETKSFPQSLMSSARNTVDDGASIATTLVSESVKSSHVVSEEFVRSRCVSGGSDMDLTMSCSGDTPAKPPGNHTTSKQASEYYIIN